MPSAQKAETKDTSPAWYFTLWKVPSVPAALAITLGFLIDIAYQPPLLFMMALSLGLLLAWLVCLVVLNVGRIVLFAFNIATDSSLLVVVELV